MAIRKCILLIPLNYNDDTEVPKEVLAQIYDQLFELAGGHYTAGSGPGAYRMESGKKQVDQCVQVWVDVDEADVPELKTMVAGFATLLDQESMYFEVVVSDIEFIKPQPKEAKP